VICAYTTLAALMRYFPLDQDMDELMAIQSIDMALQTHEMSKNCISIALPHPRGLSSDAHTGC
jgi:hypothetical protein